MFSNASVLNITLPRVCDDTGNANDVLLRYLGMAKTKIQSCIIYASTSVIIEIDAIGDKKGILKQINKKNESNYKQS